MVMDVIETERCPVCGANVGDALGVCHFYPEGRRVTLCGPSCAGDFLRGGTRPIAGDNRRNYLEELAEEKHWALWR
jgi:hypothetical protein